MKYEYIYYIEDTSFDYGDFTHYETSPHGFEIEIDCNNNVDISTLRGFGGYYFMCEIKTLQELKNVLVSQMNEIEIQKNVELFEELIRFISVQITNERKAA